MKNPIFVDTHGFQSHLPEEFLLFRAPRKSGRLTDLSFMSLLSKYFCNFDKKASTLPSSQSLNCPEKQRLQCTSSPNSLHTHASFEVAMANNEGKEMLKAISLHPVSFHNFTALPSFDLHC